MEFRQLRYFVTLVQSASSQQLQRLERELGVLLLDRTTHHVELTPAGRAFLIEARQILRQVQEQCPELEIRRVEAGVPEQFRLLGDGRLDVGIGWASLAPPEVTSELCRLDPLGVLVPEGHRLAASQEVPVAKLAAQLAASRGSCAGVVGAA